MRKIFRSLVLLGILSLTLSACSTDNDFSLGTRYWGFGRVEAVDGDTKNGFDVRLDDGVWLAINNGQAIRNVEDGERIYFKFTLLGELQPVDGYKRYIAVLNSGRTILSKEPVLQSFINEDYEHRQDSIGFDPIRVDAAAFGGRYLNIRFSVARKVNSNELHFINLVADDVDSEGVVNVYMRHNGYKDVPEPGSTNFRYVENNLVSFDLLGLIPEGEDGVKIRLIWSEYTGTGWRDVVEESEYMGLFIPYKNTDNDLGTGEPGTDANTNLR